MHFLRDILDFTQGVVKEVSCTDYVIPDRVDAVRREVNMDSENLDSSIILLTLLGNLKQTISSTNPHFPISVMGILLSAMPNSGRCMNQLDNMTCTSA